MMALATPAKVHTATPHCSSTLQVLQHHISQPLLGTQRLCMCGLGFQANREKISLGLSGQGGTSKCLKNAGQ